MNSLVNLVLSINEVLTRQIPQVYSKARQIVSAHLVADVGPLSQQGHYHQYVW